MPHFFVKKITTYTLPLTFLLTASLSAGENDSAGLKLTSSVQKMKAELKIALRDKGTITGDELTANRRRTRMGIQEKAILTLDGKNLGDPSKIKWTVKEGEDACSVVPDDEGAKATLTINANVKETTTIVVEAKNEYDETSSLSFTAVPPQEITGQHQKKSNAPGETERGVPLGADLGYPQDGDTQLAGASARLELTIAPLDVSFSKVKILEKDRGTFPEGGGPGHNPNPASVEIGDYNDAGDQIGYKAQADSLRNTLKQMQAAGQPLPHTFRWLCRWQTAAGVPIGDNIWQTFSFHLSPGQQGRPDGVHVSVSKFGCATSRHTHPNNKHSFTRE